MGRNPVGSGPAKACDDPRGTTLDGPAARALRAVGEGALRPERHADISAYAKAAARLSATARSCAGTTAVATASCSEVVFQPPRCGEDRRSVIAGSRFPRTHRRDELGARPAQERIRFLFEGNGGR